MSTTTKPANGQIVQLNVYGKDAVYGNPLFAGDVVVVDQSYGDNIIVAPKGHESDSAMQRHVKVTHIA